MAQSQRHLATKYSASQVNLYSELDEGDSPLKKAESDSDEVLEASVVRNVQRRKRTRKITDGQTSQVTLS